MDLPPGLLTNFGAATFREGIKRVANKHDATDPTRLIVTHVPVRPQFYLTQRRKGAKDQRVARAPSIYLGSVAGNGWAKPIPS
jgi:hypothetical protein